MLERRFAADVVDGIGEEASAIVGVIAFDGSAETVGTYHHEVGHFNAARAIEESRFVGFGNADNESHVGSNEFVESAFVAILCLADVVGFFSVAEDLVMSDVAKECVVGGVGAVGKAVGLISRTLG